MNVDAGTLAAFGVGLNIVTTIGGGFFFLGVTKGRLDRMERDVKETKALLITAAVEADRLRRAEADIENVENDLKLLRRGIGWVNDSHASGVNREY